MQGHETCNLSLSPDLTGQEKGFISLVRNYIRVVRGRKSSTICLGNLELHPPLKLCYRCHADDVDLVAGTENDLQRLLFNFNFSY